MGPAVPESYLSASAAFPALCRALERKLHVSFRANAVGTRIALVEVESLSPQVKNAA